ncbi:NAD(P)-dependent oxidoreductase [Parasulfitobacter algicola]|uniref:NAD(P)-dependent oxidoreductase n=1 Tax=Parasulfitobacter algicola TaxID=2614809 RepID=A0ABX2ISY8_9RHOB|nr:NAD(P)-binding domain-containing protein [Sulfitobacter algicola]NSX56012.1 NAD(P)-dependent oxidoreductase [Sulfitobacter algicola]
MQIGIAGCGRMGAPMLRALFSSDFPARGFDIRPRSDFGDLPVMDDPLGFADGLTHLITVVRDQQETDNLLFDQQKIIEIAVDLKYLIISSTLSPRYVTDLRDRVPSHIHLIDAPMSGAEIAAQECRLSFMLGGEIEHLETLQPIFDAMGKTFHHMGAYGAGMQAKVLNNLLAAASTAMTRQVLDWAGQAGLDQRKFLDLVDASSGQNWLASGFETIEFAKDGYAPDNTIGILVKDIQAALDALPGTADTALPQAIQTAIRQLKPLEKN